MTIPTATRKIWICVTVFMLVFLITASSVQAVHAGSAWQDDGRQVVAAQATPGAGTPASPDNAPGGSTPVSPVLVIGLGIVLLGLAVERSRRKKRT